jgi:hypothetical protein
MRVILISVVAGVMLAAGMAGTALAGQPNQSCQMQTTTPGSAGSAPGSAFNTGGVAGTQYAGTQPQNSNKGNGNSVSQYDVACFQVSNPPR